jgi:hypothetical protein
MVHKYLSCALSVFGGVCRQTPLENKDLRFPIHFVRLLVMYDRAIGFDFRPEQELLITTSEPNLGPSKFPSQWILEESSLRRSIADVGLKVTSHLSRHCRDPECARTSTTHIFLYVVLTRGKLHLVATL